MYISSNDWKLFLKFFTQPLSRNFNTFMITKTLNIQIDSLDNTASIGHITFFISEHVQY